MHRPVGGLKLENASRMVSSQDIFVYVRHLCCLIVFCVCMFIARLSCALVECLFSFWFSIIRILLRRIVVRYSDNNSSVMHICAIYFRLVLYDCNKVTGLFFSNKFFCKELAKNNRRKYVKVNTRNLPVSWMRRITKWRLIWFLFLWLCDYIGLHALGAPTGNIIVSLLFVLRHFYLARSRFFRCCW